jgi:methylmalonyl-CoA/ethylmalonyl-CoA epimerase
MPIVKRIDHIGVVVDDFEASFKFWRDALGLEVAQIVDVPAEKSRVAFLPVGGSEVELVKPTTSDSGLTRFLEKHGGGMHHVCLEVDDLQVLLAKLKARGIQLINEAPLTAPNGNRYAFVHPKSTGGVLVELYELSKRD